MNIYEPYISDPDQRMVLEESMHGKLPYTLMNDFLAKYSLQNDLFALSGLIAALLRIPVESITDIVILNPIEAAETLTEKTCILDVKLELNGNTILDVEIQTRRQDFWPERSITYLCRNFDHLKNGDSYQSIHRCVQIGILSNSLFKEDDPRYTEQFLSVYRLLNTVSHTEYSSKFEILVLSLNQTENATKEDRQGSNGLYYWAKLFRASSWEELKMIAQKNPRMQSFVGTVRKLSADEKVTMACEARRRYSIEIATYEQEVEEAKKKSMIAQQDAEEAEKRSLYAEQKTEEAEKRSLYAEKKTELAENELKTAKSQLEELEYRNSQQERRIAELLAHIEDAKKSGINTYV